MKRIVPHKNLIFLDDDSSPVAIDCSGLPGEIAFVGWDGSEKWVELRPFTGRVLDYDFTTIDGLFTEAETVKAAAALPPAKVGRRRAYMLERLERKRIKEMAAGVSWRGKVFPLDRESLDLLDLAAQYLERNPAGKIKRAGLGELDAASLSGLRLEIDSRLKLILDRESDLYDEIAAADQVQDLADIDINLGW